jgi:hypothetical protein
MELVVETLVLLQANTSMRFSVETTRHYYKDLCSRPQGPSIGLTWLTCMLSNQVPLSNSLRLLPNQDLKSSLLEILWLLKIWLGLFLLFKSILNGVQSVLNKILLDSQVLISLLNKAYHRIQQHWLDQGPWLTILNFIRNSLEKMTLWLTWKLNCNMSVKICLIIPLSHFRYQFLKANSHHLNTFSKSF